MNFGTILTSGQAVPTATDSLATGTATLSLDTTGNALNYSLTVVGLDFGAFVDDGIPQTADTADDVTAVDFGYAPLGAAGDLALGIVGVSQDDDLTFQSNPDGSTTISGIWDESDLASVPLSTYLPGIKSAATTTAESGTLQVSDLYLNVSTVGHPEGAIRGQIAAVSPEISELLTTVDPIVMNGLIGQDVAPI